MDRQAEAGVTSAGREITWDGFHNARDLGGLPAGGQVTHRLALIRSADLRFVTAAGWRAAHRAGIRTIVDLRNDDEVWPQAGPGPTALGGSAQFAAPVVSGPAAPPAMQRVQVPLDGVEDTEFWRQLNDQRLNGTPLYYRPFLERKPDRCAGAVTAVARARPGGVIFHCGAGRDRAGLLTLLVLALVGVSAEVIAADYQLSTEPLRALFAVMGRDDDSPVIERILADRGTAAREAILATLDGFDVEAYLLAAGVAGDDLAFLRSRLLG
jgi:hypothetical protein